MKDPDCVGCAVHAGYIGIEDIGELEWEVNIEVEVDAIVGDMRELVV